MVIRINVKIKNLYEMALKTGKHYKHIFCNIIILDNSAGQILNPSGLFFFQTFGLLMAAMGQCVYQTHVYVCCIIYAVTARFSVVW